MPGEFWSNLSHVFGSDCVCYLLPTKPRVIANYLELLYTDYEIRHII